MHVSFYLQTVVITHKQFDWRSGDLDIESAGHTCGEQIRNKHVCYIVAKHFIVLKG